VAEVTVHQLQHLVYLEARQQVEQVRKIREEVVVEQGLEILQVEATVGLV
jgi:hypothetical protein